MSQEVACISSGIFCLIAAAFGVAQGDLVAGIAGALFGLAYTKPDHWGTWLNVPRTDSRASNAYYWMRRILVVAFILIATAVICTIVAQAAQVASGEQGTLVPGWIAKVNSRALSLAFSFGGQWALPRFFKWAAARYLGAQR